MVRGSKFGVDVQSTGPNQISRTFPLQSRSFASAMAISPDASRVAVASEGTISVVQGALPYVSPADPGLEGGRVADPLSGIGAAVTDLSFVGGISVSSEPASTLSPCGTFANNPA